MNYWPRSKNSTSPWIESKSLSRAGSFPTASCCRWHFVRMRRANVGRHQLGGLERRHEGMSNTQAKPHTQAKEASHAATKSDG
jgi:hypothetical protein